MLSEVEAGWRRTEAQLRRTPHVQNRISPDHVMIMDDDTGLSRIMTDLAERPAQSREPGAADSRPFPARNARRFICIEIIGRRGIGHEDQPDIAEAIDRHQGIPPGARVPAGDAHQVQHQPRPEERPDMVEIALEVRMHARKDEAAPYQTDRDNPGRVILENAKRLSEPQSCSGHSASGRRTFAPQLPG